jgi:hypothetical protein
LLFGQEFNFLETNCSITQIPNQSNWTSQLKQSGNPCFGKPKRKIMDTEMISHGIEIPIALFRVFNFRVEKGFCSLGKNLTF